jgi:hypothetical protein
MREGAGIEAANGKQGAAVQAVIAVACKSVSGELGSFC